MATNFLFLGDSSAPTRPSNHRRPRRTPSSFRHSYPNSHGLISIRTHRSIEKDRNVLAAILSIVVIAILSTSLAQFKWFSIYNDLCDSHFYSKSESTEKGIKILLKFILFFQLNILCRLEFQLRSNNETTSYSSPTTIYQCAIITFRLPYFISCNTLWVRTWLQIRMLYTANNRLETCHNWTVFSGNNEQQYSIFLGYNWRKT